MEVTPAGGNTQIQKEHSSTSQSSQMEMSKDLGNTKIMQKAQSFSSDERALMVEQSSSATLESTRSVSVTSSVSSSKKVTSSKVTSASSFEMSEENDNMITSSMIQDNNFDSLKFSSNMPELDPGPIKLESDITSNISSLKMDSESIKSENVEKMSTQTKDMEQESFKSMNMETEAISSNTPATVSFTSTMEQDSINMENKEKYNKVSPEIEEGKIKNTLKEIITEIDAYAEKDEVLKESTKVEEMEVTVSDGVTEKYEKICDFQSMETVESNGKPEIRTHQDMLVARLPSCLHTSKGDRPLSLPSDTLMQLIKQNQVTEEKNESFHSEEVQNQNTNQVRRV